MAEGNARQVGPWKKTIFYFFYFPSYDAKSEFNHWILFPHLDTSYPQVWIKSIRWVHFYAKILNISYQITMFLS